MEKTSSSPTTTGEPPLPWTGLYFSSWLAHTALPSAASRQAVPTCPKWTYTRPPSTNGVGLAWLFFWWMRGASAAGCAKTSTFQTTFPVFASRQRALSEWSALRPSPAGTAVVRNTLPPAVTGDDQPRPGTGCFQATFLSGLNSTGGRASAAMPCPVGPRNWFQSPRALGGEAGQNDERERIVH